MDQLNVHQYNVSYEDLNNAVIAQFSLQSEWNNAIDYIDANIDDFNEKLAGVARFSKKAQEDDYAIY